MFLITQKDLQNQKPLPELYIEEEYPEFSQEIERIKSNPSFPFFLNLTRLLKQALEGGIDSINHNMLFEVRNSSSTPNINSWNEIERLIP